MQPFTRRLQINKNPFTNPRPMGFGLPRMSPPTPPINAQHITPQQVQMLRNAWQRRQPVASSRQGPKF